MIASAYSDNGDVSGNQGAGDTWLVHTNANDSVLWQVCHGGSAADSWSQVIATSDGGVACIGATNSNDGDVIGNHGMLDLWVMKFRDPSVQVPERSISTVLTVFPDPATAEITVATSVREPFTMIEVFDAAGHRVLAEAFTSAADQRTLDIKDLASGVYGIRGWCKGVPLFARFVKE
jgi:hypothetical protein